MATQLIVFAFMLFIHVSLRGKSLAVDEEEEVKTLPTAADMDKEGAAAVILTAQEDKHDSSHSKQ